MDSMMNGDSEGFLNLNELFGDGMDTDALCFRFSALLSGGVLGEMSCCCITGGDRCGCCGCWCCMARRWWACA